MPVGLDDLLFEFVFNDDFDDGYALVGDELEERRAEEPLSQAELVNFFSVVDNECLSSQPEVGASLPWETGPMRFVFGTVSEDVDLPAPV